MADLLSTDPGPLPGGEAETSILLHLAPSLVRLDRARDQPLTVAEYARYRAGRLRVPDENARSLGCPSSASALTGRALYERVRERVGQRLFLTTDGDE